MLCTTAINTSNTIKAKFHYTGPMGPDRTDFVGDPHGPNGVSRRPRPQKKSVRVRSVPVGPVLWNLAIRTQLLQFPSLLHDCSAADGVSSTPLNPQSFSIRIVLLDIKEGIRNVPRSAANTARSNVGVVQSGNLLSAFYVYPLMSINNAQ